MRSINRLAEYEPHSSESSESRTEEFVRLYSRHESKVRGFLATLLPVRSEVDDLFQRTSIVLWRKFDQFQPDSDFGAWACQIAKLEVQNYFRVRGRDRHCFSEAVLTSLADVRMALDDELELRRQALHHCIAKLRESDQAIVRECYGPDATTAKDAADHLGRPVNTLYKALIRIRRALFECIERAMGERSK